MAGDGDHYVVRHLAVQYGRQGTDSLTATAADRFDVGEYRTVLVHGPSG